MRPGLRSGELRRRSDFYELDANCPDEPPDELERRDDLTGLDASEPLAGDPAPVCQLIACESALLAHHAERGGELGVGCSRRCHER
jgi:hypothetical protein